MIESPKESNARPASPGGQDYRDVIDGSLKRDPRGELINGGLSYDPSVRLRSLGRVSVLGGVMTTIKPKDGSLNGLRSFMNSVVVVLLSSRLDQT